MSHNCVHNKNEVLLSFHNTSSVVFTLPDHFICFCILQSERASKQLSQKNDFQHHEKEENEMNNEVDTTQQQSEVRIIQSIDHKYI